MAAPVALVTGAARRIGARIARRLHQPGYDVIVH
ncbi:MAG: pteridine reductase, partial [Alcanivorax sp.]|nr:pteridine reductase [Alcanivorax sp.]